MAAAGARVFYLGYLNLLTALDAIDQTGQTAAARVLARARAAGLLTCVDLVSVDVPLFRATVEATLPQIDWLFLNEVEAARATGLAIDGPGDRAGLARAGNQLLAKGVQRGVVLHTALVGLALMAGNRVVEAPALPIAPEQIASPLGAGDAFCAGVILGLHEGWNPAAALALGHRAARATLGVFTATGGILPLARMMPDHPNLLP